MSQVIGLASKYIPMLDEKYKRAAITSVLDAPPELVRESMTANSIYIPNVAMQGLGDYNTSTGFVSGDVTFTWVQHQFTNDRGRTFSIDAVENMETIDLAFGSVAGQFIDLHVAPEVDAYRFAKLYTAAAAVGQSPTAADLANTTAVEAIDEGIKTLLDGNVPRERLVLFVSYEVENFIKQSDQFSRQFLVNAGSPVINRSVGTFDGIPVIGVPRNRFYDSITLYDGTTGGQEAGGYVKTASTGKDLNFVLVDAGSMLGITKTSVPRIFDPMTNQTAHAWKFDYRLYHDFFVPTNKRNGVYVHRKA